MTGLDLPNVPHRYARFSDIPLISISDSQRLPLNDTDDPNVRADWERYEREVKPLLGRAGIRSRGRAWGRGEVRAPAAAERLALLDSFFTPPSEDHGAAPAGGRSPRPTVV